jgi:hypothetical protein
MEKLGLALAEKNLAVSCTVCVVLISQQS